MIVRNRLAAVAFATALVLGIQAQGRARGHLPSTPTLRPASQFVSIADPRERAQALFAEAGKVLQHPRCLNCHPKDDSPRQGETMRWHDPPVTRGKDGFGAPGMRCSTCHTENNFAHTPEKSVPGSHNWHLAPVEMAWVDRSLGEICRQLKDRSRNGGKSMAQVVEHMKHDRLVGWGWAPGPGRSSAPGTQKEFGALIQAWAESGAHCPA
jgi:hypothetical protein